MLSPRAVTSLPRRMLIYLRSKPITWFDDEGFCACRYPRTPAEFEEFVARDVTLVVNLHERPHPSGLLARFALNELHLPVRDFGCPTPSQIDAAVAAIEQTVAGGHRVAVHCGGGLGRTGTLLACYLVRRGLRPEEALARIRSARPGSVETAAQEATVAAYAQRLAAG